MADIQGQDARDADEEIIELTEVAEALPEETADTTIELTDVVEAPPEETADTTIELTDVVEDIPVPAETESAAENAPVSLDEIADEPAQAAEAVDLDAAIDSEVIEIAGDDLAEPLEFADEMPEDFGDDEDDDFASSLGMEIGEDDEDTDEAMAEDAAEEAGETAVPDSDAETETPADAGTEKIDLYDLPPEQIDAALERVIHKMFYDKIESVLERLIAREVSKEIERIKRILLEEAADNDY